MSTFLNNFKDCVIQTHVLLLLGRFTRFQREIKVFVDISIEIYEKLSIIGFVQNVQNIISKKFVTSKARLKTY